MGDSFSVDPYASNNRMWYAKMAERLSQRLRKPLTDFYVMAGGGGGWGTYQQFLLSEQLKSKIRPDLFVLQFCSNDFENNYYEWERNSIVRAQFLQRPFINTEGTGPKYAPGLIAGFYRSYLGQSRVLNRLDTEITRIQFQYFGGYMRPLQPNILEAYQKESISLTTRLLSKLRRQYKDIPAVMVNCDGSTSGINSVWKNMARTAGFVPISAPSDALYAIKLQNTRLEAFISDGSHFSEMGNQIFGRLLADELVAQNILLH